MKVQTKPQASNNIQDERVLPSEKYAVRTMPAQLGKFDMTATYVMALFLVTNAVVAASGGPVSLTYLVLGALAFFLPCVVAVTQLGVMWPHEGSLYNWTTRALNPLWGFFIALCYWLTGVLAMITAGSAFVQTLQGLNSAWLTAPWQQGLVIIGLLCVAGVLSLQRMRLTQYFINTAFCTTLLMVALIGLAALVWLFRGHATQTNFSHPAAWAINPSNFFLFAIITLNYIGASGPLNLAGEIKGSGKDAGQVARIVRDHLWIGTPIVIGLYLIVALSVLIVRGESTLQTSLLLPFEAFTAVGRVFGTPFAELTVVCFLLYCIAAIVFYGYSSGRLLFVAGVDRQLPSRFGRLNRHRVPGFAMIFQLLASALVVVFIYVFLPPVMVNFFGGANANMSNEIYTVTAASCTLIWTITTLFFFINLIALYVKDRATFVSQRQFPMWVIWLSVVVGSLACLLTIAAILIYPWLAQIAPSSWGYLVGGTAIGLLLIAGVACMLASMEASWENFAR
ncbi:MAG TPA: APC family permease [Ktedonobacteraceae bacterium]